MTMTWSELWIKVAKCWELGPYEEVQGRIFINPPGLSGPISGICGTIEQILAQWTGMDPGSFILLQKAYRRIRLESPAHRDEKMYDAMWYWPRTLEGAWQRAEFCRRVALEPEPEY
jgi:hypothetical protein